MGPSVTDAVVHSCQGLQTQMHSLQNGMLAEEQTHGLMQAMQPSYESTYQEVHKQDLERLRSCVQRPEPGTFMHTDLLWASHIRMKGRRSDPRTPASVSVAYIPWGRVQDFVKGEEARCDAPCKFVCQGTTSNKQGDLMFPRWNSYSAVVRCLCNMSFDQDCAFFNVTTFKQVHFLLDITLSVAIIVDAIPNMQVSLPVWTKRQCIAHPTRYRRDVPEETEARCERQICSKWKGSHGATHIC
jgi:hypothetical protein